MGQRLDRNPVDSDNWAVLKQSQKKTTRAQEVWTCWKRDDPAFKARKCTIGYFQPQPKWGKMPALCNALSSYSCAMRPMRLRASEMDGSWRACPEPAKHCRLWNSNQLKAK